MACTWKVVSLCFSQNEKGEIVSVKPKAMPLRGAQMAMLALLLTYWFLTTQNLQQFPRIHYDEAIIVTPGHKLFAEGAFGSDLYTGFHRQEQIYLETPPLMPFLQGVSTWLLGVGVWQMRFLGLVAGLVVLSLTYAVGSCIVGSRPVGVLAAGLLLTWRLTPGGDAFLGSGITLLDVARIARYDILVPALGLGSLLLWKKALDSVEGTEHTAVADPQRVRAVNSWYFLGAGLLAGLAGFANLYGLFWAGALGFVWLVKALATHAAGKGFLRRRLLAGLGHFVLGFGIPWLGWGIVLGLNWEAATGQFVKHSGRLDFLDPAFYLDNLIREPHRYALGAREIASYGRLGFWLFVVAVPLCILWLTGRGWRNHDQRAWFLLAPAIVIPLALALFESMKRHYYVVTVVPLLAVLVAWGLLAFTRKMLTRGKRSLWMTLGLLFVALWIGQWLVGIAQWQKAAARRTEPAPFFDELRTLLPADSLTLGPPHYWFAFHDREYRSLGLVFVRSNPGDPDLVTFLTALEQVAPDYLLLHPSLTNGLDVTDDFDGGSRKADFERFMAQHEAQLMAELNDFNGDSVWVYRLAKEGE